MTKQINTDIFDETELPGLSGVADIWFTEKFQGAVKYSLRITKLIHEEKTDFQHLAIFDTPNHGRVLTLDGIVMFTETDEFIYHELITHVPMQTMPDAKKALIIGGGDGGTIRELVKYPQLEKITLVEIDERVVETSKEFLPKLSSGFSDPRVECKFEDGAKFIKNIEPASIDLLIVDSTDPVGPGKILFGGEFYRDSRKALSANGVMTAQTETPFYHGEFIGELYAELAEVFGNSWMYWGVMPSYMGALWSFCYSSPNKHPLKDMSENNISELACKYYSKEMHKSAFTLPPFVSKYLPKGHEQR